MCIYSSDRTLFAGITSRGEFVLPDFTFVFILESAYISVEFQLSNKYSFFIEYCSLSHASFVLCSRIIQSVRDTITVATQLDNVIHIYGPHRKGRKADFSPKIYATTRKKGRQAWKVASWTYEHWLKVFHSERLVPFVRVCIILLEFVQVATKKIIPEIREKVNSWAYEHIYLWTCSSFSRCTLLNRTQ